MDEGIWKRRVVMNGIYEGVCMMASGRMDEHDLCDDSEAFVGVVMGVHYQRERYSYPCTVAPYPCLYVTQAAGHLQAKACRRLFPHFTFEI